MGLSATMKIDEIDTVLYGGAVTMGSANSLVAAVAVLVVACPCAMGLATPAAIMVGTGRAAELGVLFRKGEALEALSHVDIVLFDKTGTLTEGRPVLVDLIESTPDEALRLAAALEGGSEHPLARAIVGAAGVIAEPDALVVYECDAYTLEKLQPTLVVLPQTVDQVVATVKHCADRQPAIIPRGAGTRGGLLRRVAGSCPRWERIQRSPSPRTMGSASMRCSRPGRFAT